MTQRLPIHPETLIWRREGLNATIEDVARWANTSPEKVQQWELGELHPTVNQAEKVAAKLMVSVAALFQPPDEQTTQPLVSFRKHFDSAHEAPSYYLLREVQKAQMQRDQLWSLLHEDETSPEPFSLRIDPSQSVAEAAATIRAWANIPVDESFYTAHSGRNHMLTVWIDLLERHSVAVFHMQDVDIDEARGLAVKDANMPLILLNPSDNQRARTFTLLHELTHLALQKSDWAQGPLSASFSTTTDVRTERFCNHVAAELMLPATLVQTYVREKWDATPHRPLTNPKAVSQIAGHYCASLSVTAIRLKTLQLIVPEVADDIVKNAKPSNEKKKGPGGGHHYRTTVQRIGRAYARAVLQAYHDGLISYATAGEMLRARKKGGVDGIRACL